MMQQWNSLGLAQEIDTYWHGQGETQFRKQVVTSLAKYIQPGDILDIGCGTGLIYEEMNKTGLLDNRKYIGGDSSIEMLSIARKRYHYIDFREIDILTLDNYADNVLCVQVLQHVFDYKPYIKQLGKATKKLLYIVSWFAEKDNLSTLDQYGCYNSEWDRILFERFVRKTIKPVSIIWEQLDERNWAIAIRVD
jgi:SAM-dependent methyltransferase